MVIAVVILSLTLPCNVFAVLGVGDVVTDPGSYTYYVEQIKVATKKYKKIEEHAKTAKSVLDETKKLRGLLEGTFDHAIDTIDDLKDLQKEITEKPTELLKYAKNFLNKELKPGEDWINPEDIIGEIFVDPRKVEDHVERIKQLTRKFHLRQKILEQAILKAEEIHASMPKQYAKIEKIAKKSNEAGSTKEAMDINNQLLAEILKALTDLISLTGYIGKAQTMANFKGVDDSELKVVEENLNKTKAASKGYVPQKEFLDKHGIDLNNSSEDEMFKILNES